VVGKLAARHAVRVALRPSPYGGTTAVVLMPNSIVVPANETDTDTNPDLRPGTDRMSGLDLDHADALALTGRRPAQPSLPEGTTRRTEAPDDLFGLARAPAPPGRDPVPAVPPPSFRLGTPPPRLGTTGLAGPGPGAPGLAPPRPGAPELAPPGPGTPGLAPPGQGTPPPPLPRRSTPGLAPPGPGREEPAAANPDPFGLRGPAANPDPFGLRGPAADPTPTPTPIPATATDAGADPGAAPGPQTAGTYRGLPRRIRQASLNPHLRDSSRAAARGADADGTPPSVTRSPEEARSLVASLQSGWQRGRESDVPDGEPADTAQGTGRQDSEAPRGEETLWMSRDWPGQASS
jgi:hypothetical protein